MFQLIQKSGREERLCVVDPLEDPNAVQILAGKMDLHGSLKQYKSHSLNTTALSKELIHLFAI